jgi:hypothetical protein
MDMDSLLRALDARTVMCELEAQQIQSTKRTKKDRSYTNTICITI